MMRSIIDQIRLSLRMDDWVIVLLVVVFVFMIVGFIFAYPL